jgi:hypothetical protein
MLMDVIDPPSGLQDIAPRKLAGSPLGSDHVTGDDLWSPLGIRWFRRFGPS